MNNNTVMVVGAGFGQLPAIEKAKEIGFRVVVVDGNPMAPGMECADYSHNIDILDIEKVVDVAVNYKISGVLTMQSDIGVPTVGAVVDALGLSGSGSDVAERCSNKILMRECFAQHGVPQPHFEVVSSPYRAIDAAHEIGFPCVIKAPDSSGSRGIVRVDKKSDVLPAFFEAMRHTRGKSVIVEEYISGLEIGAQAFSIGGKCRMVLIHDDELSSPPYMIPVAHAFPCSLSKKDLEKAESAVMRSVDALGIMDGPSNIDLIIDIEGNPRIIEIGARIGATCLPELVFYYTGIDWTQASLQSACGITPDLTIIRSQPCAAFILESFEDGVMADYQLSKPLVEHPDVLEWEVTAVSGGKVSRLRKGTDRVGKVITKGDTVLEALNLARSFHDAFNIQIMPDAQGEKND